MIKKKPVKSLSMTPTPITSQKIYYKVRLISKILQNNDIFTFTSTKQSGFVRPLDGHEIRLIVFLTNH